MTAWMVVIVVSKSSTSVLIETFMTDWSSTITNCAVASAMSAHRFALVFVSAVVAATAAILRSRVTSEAMLTRFGPTSDADDVYAALDRDGAVIVEGLLAPEVVQRVNDEVEEAVAAADPAEKLFDPVIEAFNGAQTRQVSGVCGISPTFAVDVVGNETLLGLADRVLLPSCARYH